MRASLSTARQRLEFQGFTGLSDEQVREFNYWLRLAPALCLAWVAVGLLYASPTIFAVLVPFAVIGAITDGHPFDVIYNRGIRHLLGTAPLPAYGLPRRFGCFMASLALSLTAVLFATGLNIAGYAIGGVLVLMLLIQVMTGFCGGAAIYWRLFGTSVPSRVERSRSS